MSKDTVSDAMIEAGADLIGGGSTFDREDRQDMARAIYLAMKALDATLTSKDTVSDAMIEAGKEAERLWNRYCTVQPARVEAIYLAMKALDATLNPAADLERAYRSGWRNAMLLKDEPRANEDAGWEIFSATLTPEPSRIVREHGDRRGSSGRRARGWPCRRHDRTEARVDEGGQTLMPILTISVPVETIERLQRAAIELGRTVDDLAESAVEEAALGWAFNRASPRPPTDAELSRSFMDGATPAWMKR